MTANMCISVVWVEKKEEKKSKKKKKKKKMENPDLLTSFIPDMLQ